MRGKQIGTLWENVVAKYLNDEGIGCERRALAGTNDRGDIVIYDMPTFTIECKAEKKFNLPGYVTELEQEVLNNKGDCGIIVVKAPRKNVSKAYVVIPLDMFVTKILRKLK